MKGALMIDERVRTVASPELIRAVEEAIRGGEGPGLDRKVWTLVNHKGGVGKTFDALALAWVLAVCFGLHVLVVDMDPQANSTRRAGYGADATMNRPTLTEALKMNITGSASGIVLPFMWKGATDNGGSIDLLPARLDLETRSHEAAVAEAVGRIRSTLKLRGKQDLLAQIEPELQEVVGSLDNPRSRLRNIISGDFIDGYDIVLIDCQPSLGHLTQMAYTASDGVLLCTKADFDSMNGAIRTREVLHQYRTEMGVPNLDVHGVLLTDLQIINRAETEKRKHGSFNAAEESIADLKEAFGDLLWQPFLERKSALAENTDYGSPITDSLSEANRVYVTDVMIHWGTKLLEVSCGSRAA